MRRPVLGRMQLEVFRRENDVHQRATVLIQQISAERTECTVLAFILSHLKAEDSEYQTATMFLSQEREEGPQTLAGETAW